MKAQCPNNCQKRSNTGGVSEYGTYYRKSDRRKVQRYKCTHCSLYFSQATFSKNFGQNKRHLNHKILQLYVSGVSQRRLSRLLNVHQITIAKKLSFLGAIKRHQNFLQRRKRLSKKVIFMQFDDLETFEHTKMKPLSMTLAVEKDTRFILGFEMARMPAKGLLARKSVKKYGLRRDDRKEARERLFRRIQSVVYEKALIESDSNPHYPESVKKYFPEANHLMFKGKRGAITGQGELKKTVYDPLFSLNHSCAMLRANVNRLFRKTWCTTKKIQPLIDHLELYVWYHNNELIS